MIEQTERDRLVAEYLYSMPAAVRPWRWTKRAERIGVVLLWLAAFALVVIASIAPDVTL